MGDKGGRWIGLTALPPSCAYCLEICEPQNTGILRVCPELYRFIFMFVFLERKLEYSRF
jgi:hypothetical protein